MNLNLTRSMLHRLTPLLLLAFLCQCQTYPRYPQTETMAPIFGAPASGPGQSPASTRPSTPGRSDAPAYPPYPQQADAPPPAASASWRVTNITPPQSLTASATHHQVQLARRGDSLRMDVVLFDSRQFRLRVIDQPNSNAGGRAINDAMRFSQATAGVNGGFFTPEFQPLGLMIARGRATGAFDKSSLITGMVLQVENQPYLIWNNEYQGPAGITDLLQAGPRLVDSSRPVPRLDSTKKRARTFIATNGNSLWALGVTDSCSLGALAQALVTPGALPGLAPMRALNLDGGNSSALWMRASSGKEISKPGWSTVRNYLAIVPN
jgi:hypothetical protein